MNAAYKYDILAKNAYEVTTSRPTLEQIKNDPFGMGSVVKGLTMDHQKKLENHAQELIAQYATYDDDGYCLLLHALPDDEQSELARLFIESTDRDISECVYGDDFSINNDYTCALLAMLKDDSQENRDHFAEVTRKNTIKYFEKALQSTLDDACHYLQAMDNEQRYFSNYDREHGDFYRSKY